jgi:hypothetical protein
VRPERSVLLLSAAVAVAGLMLIGVVIGLVVLLDPIP